MKSRFSVINAVLLLLSVLMTAGALTFLGPCMHEDGSFGTCHWAGQVCAALGGALSLLSLAALLVRERMLKAGLLLGMVPAALLAAFVPGRMLPLCIMKTMRCQSVMKPAMLLLGLVITLLALIYAWSLMRKEKHAHP